MSEQNDEGKEQEVLIFINGLIQSTMYPYAHQAKGVYDAKDIKAIIHKTLLEARQSQEPISLSCRKAGKTICTAISEGIEGYMESQNKGFVYHLEYKVFEIEIGNEIEKILW